MTAPLRILLGPQNPVRNVGNAIDASDIPGGPIAVVSAGWQEAENDLGELRSVVGRALEDLELHRRAERVFREDAELAAAYRRRQDGLREQQRLYRERLRSLAAGARRMFRLEGDERMLATEQRHAIAQLRALDRHHVNRTEAWHHGFDEAYAPRARPAVRREADEMAAVIARSSAVLITGGNIAVIVNRLRLFGLGGALAGSHVVAWSAGAMCLASRIVLFHERMPQGRREPEVLGAGLGLVSGCIVLPDAKHRLRSGDRLRAGVMARRFSPDQCVTLDNDTVLVWRGGDIVRADGARRLRRNGRSGRLRAA